MIILPPEERKPSRVLKWTFRLLMGCIVLFCLFLFMLKILSGTSESHRRGLEQAMSDIFKSKVTIGTLKTFNIFPQFLIEMDHLRAQGVGGMVFDAASVRLAFSFGDIFFKRDNLEDILITNLAFAPGVIGEEGLLLESVRIEPESALKQPAVHMQGLYGSRPFVVDFGIKQVAGVGRPRYEIPQKNPFRIVSGPFQFSAVYQLDSSNQPSMEQAVLTLNDKQIADGRVVVLRDGQTTRFESHFKSGDSAGTLTTGLNGQDWLWKFDTLDLADVYGEASLRTLITKAWREMPEGKSAAQPLTSSPPSLIEIVLRKLSGAVTAEDVHGRFVVSDEAMTGWVVGKVTSMPHKPEAGSLDCALIDLKAAGDRLKADAVPLHFGATALKGTFSYDRESGAASFGVDRKAGAADSLFGLKPDAFLMHQNELHLEESPACSRLLGAEVKKDAP